MTASKRIGDGPFDGGCLPGNGLDDVATAAARRDRRRLLAAGAALGAGWWLPAGPARAAIGGLPNAAHGDSSPEWDRLRPKLFGDRPLLPGGAVRLVVPLRAAYGASVPVKVVSTLPQTPGRHVRRMHLVVDKNPSPVAAVLDLGVDLGQADFETRLRVDEYSHVRVVSELSTGELYTDSRFVKVSGGCSAPPNRDQLHNIGKTAFRLPDGLHLNAPTTAEVQVVHPNDTGFELNHVTVMFIPPHFVRSLKVRWLEAGVARQLFDAELDFSISENPSLRFCFVPHGPGELQAEVEDTKDGRFRGRLEVAA